MITPEQVGERYLAVDHRMFRAVNDEMAGCGLSVARTKVLRRLCEQGPTRQSVLAANCARPRTPSPTSSTGWSVSAWPNAGGNPGKIAGPSWSRSPTRAGPP